MNKIALLLSFIFLTIVLSLFISGCSTKNGNLVSKITSKQKYEIIKKDFKRFHEGLYHNIIVLKFKDYIPIRMLQIDGNVPASPRIGNEITIISRKKLVYFPSVSPV